MCTAVAYQNGALYFGRNLDYEVTYGEQVTILPRHFPLHLRYGPVLRQHYAMIGMAHVRDSYPLYYDGCNEMGLCIAGLNFPKSAVYAAPGAGQNIAAFELIPWLLATAKDLAQAKAQLAACRLVGTPFSPDLPTAQLHWMIADETGCIALEYGPAGLQIYENPTGVLTNEPPFPMQLRALSAYRGLSPRQPESTFAPDLPLPPDSRGMGTVGLPGDLSSQGRFIRAAFVRANSLAPQEETASIGQLFHILDAVTQPRGCCQVAPGAWEYTQYTGCCSPATGTYYYTTYENRQITAVTMNEATRKGTTLRIFPLEKHQKIARTTQPGEQ